MLGSHADRVLKLLEHERRGMWTHEMASILGIASANLTNALVPAVNAGLLVRKVATREKGGGRGALWSLGSGEPVKRRSHPERATPVVFEAKPDPRYFVPATHRGEFAALLPGQYVAEAQTCAARAVR